MRLVRIAIQSRLQYRADFVTGVIGVIVMNVVNIGLIAILINRFTNLNGWTAWRCSLLVQPVDPGRHSLFSMFMWHMRTLEDYLVRTLHLFLLIRPASPFVLFLGREVQYLGIADFAIGVGGLSLSYTNLHLSWDRPIGSSGPCDPGGHLDRDDDHADDRVRCLLDRALAPGERPGDTNST